MTTCACGKVVERVTAFDGAPITLEPDDIGPWIVHPDTGKADGFHGEYLGLPQYVQHSCAATAEERVRNIWELYP
jgi:hypothetical protein